MEKLICVLGALVLFIGCRPAEVDSNGAVSPQVASQLTSYQGNYRGPLVIHNSRGLDQLIQQNFTLNFSIQGDRPVITTFSDLLGPNCNSRVGKLLSVTTGGIWKAIATFAFDPGSCAQMVSGRIMTIYVDDTHAMLSLPKPPQTVSASPSIEQEQLEYEVSLTR